MQKYYIYIILAIALIVRLWAAFNLNYMSHPTDMISFRFWANMLANDGFASFYGSDVFTDYPPGYMYILMITGSITQSLGLDFASVTHNMLIKLPAMLFDIATIAFIYKIAMNFGKSDNANSNRNSAAIAALIYALNPAIILNSAVWGQVDSIHTFLLVVSVYFIGQRKMLPSVLLFTISILVKPQSFIFAPIYLFMFFKYIFGENYQKINPQNNKRLENLKRLALYGAICLLLISVLSVPFVDFSAMPNRFLDIPIVSQYINTFTSYDLITNNAYNLWTMLGLNGANLTFGVSFLGFASLVTLTFLAFFLLWKKNDTGSIFLVGAVLMIGTFLLSIRMHERYNFPAIAFLLLAYITLRDKRLLYIYLAYSAMHFLNNLDVLFMSVNGFNRIQIAYSAVVFAIPLVIISSYAIYMAITVFFGKPKITLIPPVWLKKRKDIAICAAITIFYAIFAFTNLGYTQSPQSRFEGVAGEAVIIDFGATHEISKVQHMLGARHNQSFTLEFSEDLINWSPPALLQVNDVFAWHYNPAHDTRARFVRITPVSHQFFMQEMAFRDIHSNLIPVHVLTPTGHELFDEQHLIPTQMRNYMHSTYFDEIYHPRTAYEFIHGMEVLEWTHPPLGKVIISWGIQIFGMTPFGWRFMGTLFGVLMLPLIYAFAKAIFKKSKNASFWSGIVTFIFAFDFMHYAQTRLATIDTYVVIFIMAMYYFIYRFMQTDFRHHKIWKPLLFLFLSGAFLGLAAASKWQGFYGAIGIAAIWLWTLIKRYLEYHKNPYDRFWTSLGVTYIASIIFFIVLPVTIYVISYIPFWNTGYLYPDRGFLAAVWQNQVDMFVYHSQLTEGHVFSSTWYEWIINYRPIFYYLNNLNNGTMQGISSFGNPLVWWGGIGALAYCIYASITRRDKVAIFLVIAWLSQILPWIPIYRVAFIYHYFPNVPFLVMMIAYTLKESCILDHKFFTNIFGTRKNIAISIAVACFALFILFYPVLTGTPIASEYVNIYLRWLPSWVLLH
ncbi:MAG: phospholipid carrier-dependent glycosyltransferase [Defluviitaleaceae bacterium]|nr:phospholipid carrier-dependent glycosyltransferase [Defluviitaleaceae bacterium]